MKMKKLATLVLSIACVGAGVAAFGSCAQGEGVTYALSDDGTYAIVIGYEGSAGKVKIADTYNGVPVTTIGNHAFYECDNLTSVVIGDSVTTIGVDAFSSCDNLTSVVIGESVTTIGLRAFQHCDSLTSIEFSDSVTTIDGGAFASCDNLTSVVIGDSVTTIGDQAFFDCDSLTSVVIGDSVTTIGDLAFCFCYSLTSIEIPDSVTTIGHGAFSGTAYSSNENNWENDVLYIGKHLIAAKTTISGAYTIKDGTVSIGEQAFSNCKSLTSVVIGDSVLTIGDHAFYFCSSLTDIEFKGTIEQWNAIKKGVDWKYNVPATKVICSDGEVAL